VTRVFDRLLQTFVCFELKAVELHRQVQRHAWLEAVANIAAKPQLDSLLFVK
jgi:hypothetical protein